MKSNPAPFAGAAVFLSAFAFASPGALPPKAPVALLPAAAAAGTPPSQEALRAAVRRIQNVCFATYPPELVKRLTGRESVPAEVREDPALQMKAFTAVDQRDKGLFYPSSLDEMLDAFASEARPGLCLLDLGSGDGRVVFLAALLGAEATGVEWEPSLHALALQARARLADLVPKGRAHLRAGDFLREDFSRYDLLFYFESGTFDTTAMFDKIRRELRPGARLLLAHGIAPPSGLEQVAEYGVVKVYVRPRSGPLP